MFRCFPHSPRTATAALDLSGIAALLHKQRMPGDEAKSTSDANFHSAHLPPVHSPYAAEMSSPTNYNDFLDDFQEEGTRVTPGRLRGQINKLLQDTDIKITEFQKIIGVNANSYGKFMHGKYKDPWSATQNGTYWAAAYFFYREKRLGNRAMGKTRAYSAAATTPVGPAAGSAKPVAKTPLPDVSGVSTDGTTYQTPAEVRKELRAVLSKYDSSVAALARAADVPYQSFNNFMKATGDFGGRDNQAYHPAAEIVERLRLATGKEKSKKRKALEAEMEEGVCDRCGQMPRSPDRPRPHRLAPSPRPIAFSGPLPRPIASRYSLVPSACLESPLIKPLLDWLMACRRTGGPKLGLDPDARYLVPAGMPLYFTKDSLGRNVMARV